jgi:hypothetical protein
VWESFGDVQKLAPSAISFVKIKCGNPFHFDKESYYSSHNALLTTSVNGVHSITSAELSEEN